MAKLGPCCSVPGCSLRPGTNLLSQIKVFRFPKEPNQRRIWTDAVNRDNWSPTINSRVCSSHFISGRPSKDPLHPDYAPSRLPQRPPRPKGAKRLQTSIKQEAPDEVPVSDTCRSDTRSRSDTCRSDSRSRSDTCRSDSRSRSDTCRSDSRAVGTDLSMKDIEDLLRENAALKLSNQQLETRLKQLEQNPIQQSAVMELQDDDDRVKFYSVLHY